MARAKLTLLAPVLAVCSCGSYTKTVETHESASIIEPEDEACLDKDVTGFLMQHLGELQACTEYFSCKKHAGMTLTLMVGCNGTRGGLYVLSHENLKKFNECIVESGEAWEYSALCTSSECECAWTQKVNVACVED